MSGRTLRFASVLTILGLLISAIPVMADSHVADEALSLSISKAPIAPDGTAAGAVTDFVITFADPDPAVDGIGLKAGATVEVVLPEAFTYVGPDERDVFVILQGWPQSPPAPPPAFPWTFAIEGHTITATLTDDYLVGAAGPGPKSVHLLLYSFRNPGTAGAYPIELHIQPDPETDETLSGNDMIQIHSSVLASVEAVSLFSGPPGPPPPFFNPIYQTVAQGETARQVGLYLWGSGGTALTGVRLEMVDPHHGQLLRGGQSIGNVWIEAPDGAWDQTLRAFNPDGGSTSVEVSAFITGVPVGLLLVEFQPDPDVTGDYVIRIQLHSGLSKTLYVSVIGG